MKGDIPPAVGQMEAISASEHATAIVPRKVMILAQHSVTVYSFNEGDGGAALTSYRTSTARRHL